MKIKPFKQLLALSLLLCLLLSYSALAEDVPLTAETFSLRNGYYFGMTMDEARKLAEEEGLEAGIHASNQGLVYHNVSVAGYVAEAFWLYFDFLETDAPVPQLVSMHYEFPAFPTDESDAHMPMFEALESSLTQKYGDQMKKKEYDAARWNYSDFRISLSTHVTNEYEDEYFFILYDFYYDPIPVATKNTDGL